MTYIHALNLKIALGPVQNESYVAKPLRAPCRMKIVLAPPPSQAGRDGRKRKHEFGVELRIIAGLLYRNPAMTYMQALKQNMLWGSCRKSLVL